VPSCLFENRAIAFEWRVHQDRRTILLAHGVVKCLDFYRVNNTHTDYFGLVFHIPANNLDNKIPFDVVE
jgi:hypothetical protein